jgi:hypothetical protein
LVDYRWHRRYHRSDRRSCLWLTRLDDGYGDDTRLGRRLWVVGRAAQNCTSAADEGPGGRADWALGPPGEREAPAYLGAGDGDGAEFSRVRAGGGFGEDGQAEASGGELGKDLGIAGLEGDVWLESGRGTGVVET